MPTVRLDFVPPINPNLAKLRIFEGPSPDGPFEMIEETTAIGTSPAYITSYSTTQADNIDDWFAIRWVQTNATELPLSQAVQGTPTTAVGEIMSRVLLRYPAADPAIVAQEAELVLTMLYGTSDPPIESISPIHMSAITQLVLARSMMWSMVSSSQSASYTAGLVQQKTDTSTATMSQGLIQAMIDGAMKQLGLSYAVVAQMQEIPVAGNAIVAVDVSRLLVEIE